MASPCVEHSMPPVKSIQKAKTHSQSQCFVAKMAAWPQNFNSVNQPHQLVQKRDLCTLPRLPLLQAPIKRYTLEAIEAVTSSGIEPVGDFVYSEQHGGVCWCSSEDAGREALVESRNASLRIQFLSDTTSRISVTARKIAWPSKELLTAGGSLCLLHPQKYLARLEQT